MPSPILPVYWCLGDYTTTGNVCAQELRHNSDGSVDGETIFVRTHCDNRMPLPSGDQDPVYQKPGVPMDRGMQEAWAETWGKEDLTAADKDSPVKCETSDGSPKVEDCRHAFGSLLQNPQVPVTAGKKGKTYWAGVCFFSPHFVPFSLFLVYRFFVLSHWKTNGCIVCPLVRNRPVLPVGLGRGFLRHQAGRYRRGRVFHHRAVFEGWRRANWRETQFREGWVQGSVGDYSHGGDAP